MRKIFCYVDESGQDTKGDLFIVSVIVSAEDHEQMIEVCETIERESGKGQVKWAKAEYTRRLAYIQRILEQPIFKSKLRFAIYHQSLEYFSLTA